MRESGIYGGAVLAAGLLLFFLSRWFPILKRPLIVLTAAAQAVYFVWRVGWTLVGYFPDLIFSLILLLAEAIGIGTAIVFWLQMGVYERKAAELRRREPFDGWYPTPDGGPPTVDVLIPTYNEPLEVLKRTLVAARTLDYPKDRLTVYVLDDGHRPEVRRLAERLGVRYLARGDRRDGKAGNLNYGLAHSDGMLVAVFDADMVPHRAFLRETVGFFRRRRVGFVQTPQTFFNPDPFQANWRLFDRLPNEQMFFMIDVQRARAAFNAVLFVGTNAVFSRRALESIGGFATGSLTEDLSTGLRLQARGWVGVFVERPLAQGMAPERFSDMIRQRERWCRGNMQSFRLDSPFRVTGLTLGQRLLYLQSMMYWFYGVQKIIYVTAPLLFLFFHIRSFQATLEGLMSFWLPQMILSMLIFRRLTDGRRSFWTSHLYETATAPWIAACLVKELSGRTQRSFWVTPKGQRNAPAVFRPGVFLFGAGFLLSLLALGKGTADVFFGRIDGLAYAVNAFWTLVNGAALLYAGLASLEAERPRKAERFPVIRWGKASPIDSGGNTDWTIRWLDVSEGGGRFLLYGHRPPWSLPVQPGQSLTVSLPDFEGPPLPATVVAVEPYRFWKQRRQKPIFSIRGDRSEARRKNEVHSPMTKDTGEQNDLTAERFGDFLAERPTHVVRIRWKTFDEEKEAALLRWLYDRLSPYADPARKETARFLVLPWNLLRFYGTRWRSKADRSRPAELPSNGPSSLSR
ncbi:MAG: glycosyltransferase [Hydrogenibacillus schlegelii]|uniref:Glycosyltransferase n=1 Tax=Hydrogenibacillus schlegelii TaxID=1484 RepID=A0A947CYQ7_HYDSH|nr:glycosyltransferase [Hydrogenibacillus schlegelii]